jgi:flagellar hook-associated protein 1
MSINTILSTAASGLWTAQTGLRLVSDNIANANTPGYVRKVMDQTAAVYDGLGQGVDVGRVRLAADRFLQATSQTARSQAAEAGVSARFLDAVQSLFGDPNGGSTLFDRLDGLFVSLDRAAALPASAVARQEAATAVGAFFNESGRIAAGLDALRAEADAALKSGLDRANTLLGQIERLNQEISRHTASGQPSLDLQNAQTVLVDELSTLLDVRATPRAAGGVSLRTTSGFPLAGESAATLSQTPGGVWIAGAGGEARPLLNHVSGGELRGLLLARDREIPAAAEQLAEFTAQTADALNKAHNASSASPPPARLAGRSTGLDAATAFAGFTGRTTIAVLDASGRITRKVDVDFSAGTLSMNGGAATAFAPGGFVSALDAALDPAGDASFTGGVLTLDARSGGIAVTDDPASPSAKAGRGFSHFFGLNDLVRASSPTLYETGLRTSDPHGFTGSITLRLSGASGAALREVSVAAPPGGTMGDLLAALNAPGSGVGLYGGFSLDGQGRLAFTPTTQPPAQLSVPRDDTTSAVGGASLSRVFGVGGAAREDRASVFSLRSDIASDPTRLALAQADLSGAPGSTALSAGDGRGGRLLADAGQAIRSFGGGDGFAAADLSLSDYGAAFAGSLGSRAAAAEDRRSAADAVSAEAQARRVSAEGVNLDEELIQMTTYQQAYNASARLIQAAKELYDVLLELT